MNHPPADKISTSSEHFSTDHLKDDIKARSVRGGAVTVASQVLRFFLQLSSTAILARLLVPEDFGLIAMVMAVVGFVSIFKDAGLSMATVQRQDITHEQVSTLFWFNVVLSTALMLIVASLSPVVAWFFGEPRLSGIALAVSISFIFAGLTIQHQALLRRQMRFSALATIEISTQIIGIIVAILLALNGFGYWSLVGMQLVCSIINCVLAWFLCGWRPGLPKRRVGVHPMLAFGGNLTAFNFMNYLNRNLDNVLIGSLIGATALGLYSKAYSLLMLPISQINAPLNKVTISALSRLQSEPLNYKKYYRRGIEIVSFLGSPLVAFTFVAADELVLLILGDQWMEAVPLFRVLAPAAMMATTNIANGWVYLSLGHVEKQVKWGVYATIFLCSAMLIGAIWGTLGIASSVSISRVIIKLPGIAYCFKGTFLQLSDFTKPVIPCLFASIAAGIFSWFLVLPFLSILDLPILKILFLFVSYALLYILIIYLMPNGKMILSNILDIKRQFSKRS